MHIFSDESLKNGNNWPHTTPNQYFHEKKQKNLDEARNAIAWNLRRGVSRLEDTIAHQLEQSKENSHEMSHVLLLGRRALQSFESFWKQAQWTFDYGKRQTEWHDEWKEYGPETNFWLKFRPTLTCSETYRMGPEIGGAKTWCNGRSLTPKLILSAGSGDDFLYEHLVAKKWKGVTIVTTDCYQFDKATNVMAFDKSLGEEGGADAGADADADAGADGSGSVSQILVLPVCLTGGETTTMSQYVQLVPPHLRSKFVSFKGMLKQLKNEVMKSENELKQDYFDLIKCNIEASEYPLFADVFRNVDVNLKGTHQINMEMHRMGMHSKGLNFHSLIFMELLFSHFYSGGYHPIFTEKWHDQNAAQDVVWVNQTSWMESELDMLRGVWVSLIFVIVSRPTIKKILFTKSILHIIFLFLILFFFCTNTMTG